jgi:hypothetical protein
MPKRARPRLSVVSDKNRGLSDGINDGINLVAEFSIQGMGAGALCTGPLKNECVFWEKCVDEYKTSS